jgi:hypothetical protein
MREIGMKVAENIRIYQQKSGLTQKQLRNS